MSAYSVIYFRKHGSMPGGGSGSGSHVPVDEQTKYAFSSNPHDEFDADEELAGGSHHAAGSSHRDEEEDYEVLHPHPEDEGGGHYDAPPPVNPHYGGVGAAGGLESDTSYHGASYHQTPDPFRNPSPNPSYHSRQPSAAGDPFRDDLDQGGWNSGGRVEFPDHHDYR